MSPYPSPAHQLPWPRRGPLNCLHAAAQRGSVERTLALLAKGSFDIDQGSPSGQTPLMFAAFSGYSRVVRILLNNHANVSMETDDGQTALHVSAQQNRLAVTKMLAKAGGDPDTPDSNGYTPLFLAAYGGHQEVMRVMIEAGANVNSRKPTGATPLYVAASNGRVGAVRVLLRAGADPLLTELVEEADVETQVPLDAAAMKGHLEVVCELMQHFGIEGCGGPSGGLHALAAAAENGHLHVMAMLMNAGVVDSGKALVAAAMTGCDASIKFLLLQQQQQQQQQENDGEFDYVNACDSVGIRALFYGSAIAAAPRVARLLIEAGADATSDVCTRTDGDDRSTLLDFVNHCLLREEAVCGSPASEETLRGLEAVRRLLLRMEAVHAVSFAWPTDDEPGVGRATICTGKTRGPRPCRPLSWMVPAVRRRAAARRVVLANLFRCDI